MKGESRESWGGAPGAQKIIGSKNSRNHESESTGKLDSEVGIGRSDGERDQPYSNGEQRQEVKTAGTRLNKSRSNREEAALEVRGQSETLDHILHDPHAEMSGLDFLLCTLDLQVHLLRDQPLQAFQKLFVIGITNFAVD